MPGFAATDAGWTPALSTDGVFYCSPRCGGGKFCRRAWYDAAVRNAEALAARMGDGWEPRVWENLGWHYSVGKGSATILVLEDRNAPFDPEIGYPITSYQAWIEPKVVISHRWIQFIEAASTPEDALGIATQAARTSISRIEEALAEIITEGRANG